MLWIALYIPELPLQLAQRICEEIRPFVISEGPETRPTVRCANKAARECGVVPGMAVASARALAGEIHVLQRDEAAEAQTLHNLGCWAYQFTPGVVLQPGEGLLLDVGSTLRLHGGLKPLLARIRKAIADLGYYAEPGVAPTPLAAWILAKARYAGIHVRMCLDIALLPARLDGLPLALLDWPAEVLTLLQTLGVRRIGECLKLPRDGFIRRFGPERLLDLDKAIGNAPDLRPCFTPPDTFANRIEFGFEINDALMLLFPLKRLLQELEGFLRGRGAGVQQWHLMLDHWNHGKTRITLGVVAPERSADRFLALARERLTQMTLNGPVLALGIAAEQILTYEESNRSFIPDPRVRAIGWNHLIDKLTTRLGNDKIYLLRTLDDHRPENAFAQNDACAGTQPLSPAKMSRAKTPRKKSAGNKAAVNKSADNSALEAQQSSVKTANFPTALVSATDVSRNNSSSRALVVQEAAAPPPLPKAPRPLWLLRTPRPLLTENGNPLYQGHLNLLAGPERIESGWWDDKRARRDYYVARNPKGETLWIYREHKRNQAWYLHGIFS